MFEPLQNLIPKEANRRGVSLIMQSAKICHDFRELTPAFFPKNKDEANKSISPAHFKQGTLTINVGSPAWAQEIIMRKPKIIAELNQKAGQEIIKDLRTQLSS